jgi:hypothetical protein
MPETGIMDLILGNREWMEKIENIFNSNERNERKPDFSAGLKEENRKNSAILQAYGNESSITVYYNKRENNVHDALYQKKENNMHDRMKRLVRNVIQKCKGLKLALSAVLDQEKSCSMYVLFFEKHVKFVVVRTKPLVYTKLGEIDYETKMKVDMIGENSFADPTDSMDRNMKRLGSCIEASSVEKWQVIFSATEEKSFIDKKELNKRLYATYPSYHKLDVCASCCKFIL